ncbi:MAG: NAD(P)(+) transhydrogenase (Re/Si-specific) subunit beta [Ignavibacteriales bacterium]|nr:NAD(P)(+) transhydrogenase (Re/Si-specific) subunit beta [Ignavibacteriales bacterium]
MNFVAESLYIVAAILFVIGLKRLGKPATARKGNLLSSVGMLLAIVGTLIHFEIMSPEYIVVGMIIGGAIGIILARIVQMTEMPQMVALLNGFGGLASLLVGWAEFHRQYENVLNPDIPHTIELYTAVTTFLTVVVGGLTFSGSVIAWAKLKEVMTGKPILFTGQQFVNAAVLLAVLVGGVIFSMNPAENYPIFIALMAVGLILGVTSVIPIGGADMPVVISLLNSYSGIAGCLAGFVIQNNVLIVTGSLVGASGIILTNIMCKAMNRSLANVLFSGFGSVVASSSSGTKGEVKSVSVEDAYYILESAGSVLFVPGYGLAVAQAQHVCRELADMLHKNGTEVSFGIHPVAGRMPGHMNVLLAEANVSYDLLKEMDEVNPTIESVDVCVVIGANDVVNPAARDEKGSPIYGMPIINVDKSKTVIVMKRSMATGFAGIENPLFYKENTRMLFGDAKNVLQNLVAEFKKG